MRPARCAPTAVLLLTCSRLGFAQGIPLRGVVTAAETGEPLGFSIVSLVPTFGRRFSDPAGAFSFPNIPAGTYLLSVRQIGYSPFDTQFVLRDHPVPFLRIALRHLAVELPALTVTGRSSCTRPGAPSRSVTPALAVVFDQLLENARRLELLADSYPFRFRLERAFQSVSKRGDSLSAEVDTLNLESTETRRPYRPGRVVEDGSGPFANSRIVSLPSLHEFGDSAFLSHHCFRLAGRDTIEGEMLVRIDFEPHEALAFSDVAGSAYLDSITYQLRFTETSLTKPRRSQIEGIRELVARIRFRDIVSGIVLPAQVRAVTTYRVGPRASRVETQRLLDVHFRRALPP
jgi:hypothetical protein